MSKRKYFLQRSIYNTFVTGNEAIDECMACTKYNLCNEKFPLIKPRCRGREFRSGLAAWLADVKSGLDERCCEMRAYRFDEDTVVITTESLDEAKRWYCKNIGDYPTDITELDPRKDTIFYPADSGQTLLPAHEAGLHRYTALCGDVYERITIDEAFARDGFPTGTYIIASIEEN